MLCAAFCIVDTLKKLHCSGQTSPRSAITSQLAQVLAPRDWVLHDFVRVEHWHENSDQFWTRVKIVTTLAAC